MASTIDLRRPLPAAQIPLFRYAISPDPNFDSTQGFLDLVADPRNKGRRLILPVRESTGTSNLTEYSVTQPIVINQSMVIAGEMQSQVQIKNQGTGNCLLFSPTDYTTPGSYLRNVGVENLTVIGTQAASTGAAVVFRRCNRLHLSQVELREHKFCLDIVGSVFGQYNKVRATASLFDGPFTAPVAGSALIRITGADLSGPEGSYPPRFPGYLHEFSQVYALVGARNGTYNINSCVLLENGDVACEFNGFYFATAGVQNILIKAAGADAQLSGVQFYNGYLDAGTAINGVRIENNALVDPTLTNIGFNNVIFGQLSRGIVADDPSLGLVKVKGCTFQNITYESVKSTGCTASSWHLHGNTHTNVGVAGLQNIIDIDGAAEVIVKDTFVSSLASNKAIRLTGTHGVVDTQGSTYKNFTTKKDYASATISDPDEGTWTPVLNIAGATTGITYNATNTVGFYEKVGSRGYRVRGRITLTSKGALTGALTIAGYTGPNPASAVLLKSGYWAGMAGIVDGVNGLVSAGGIITLYNGGGVGMAALTDANITNTSDFFFEFNYHV